MATRVAYLAESLGSVDRAWALGMPELLRASGGNAGNLAFWHAARLLFDADEVTMISRDTRAAAVPASVEVVVIPAANYLHAGAELGRLAELLRALNRPCLVVGLGVQAEVEAAPPALTAGTRDFLAELARLAPTVCVRGDYTRDFCAALGVSNLAALGCPSLLINPDRELGAAIEARIAALPESGPVAVHAACIKAPLQGVERELARLVRLEPGSAYLVQRPLELMRAVHGEAMQGAEEQAYFARCAGFLGFPGPEALGRFLRTHGRVPVSLADWAHGLRRFIAGVNTRIHGTMIGLMAGLPSLCVCHDTRTRELARQHCVPQLTPGGLIEHRHSLAALFAAAGFSGRAFDEGRARMAEGYADAVRAVGLVPSRHLLGFAAA